MSDKDFAHIERHTADEGSPESSKQNKTVLIVLLATIFAIVCFGAGFFMGEKHGQQRSQGNKYQTLVSKLKEQQKKIESYKKQMEATRNQEADTSQIGELTFYNQLPRQSVTPEPLNATVTAKATQPGVTDETPEDIALTEQRLNAIIEKQLQTPQQQFRIQIASFKQASDANRFVQELLQADIPAQVQKVSLANLGIRYRVLTLPFSRRDKALQAKAHIKEKFHITGILVSE